MKIAATLALSLICTAAFAQKNFTLNAPDGKLQVKVSVSNDVTYSVIHDGDVMVEPSPVSMKLTNGTALGVKPKLSGSSTKKVNSTIKTPIYKHAQIPDVYNELTLNFKGNYKIVFRAYDEGMAYRFVYTSAKPFEVENEVASFCFPTDAKAFIPYVRDKGTFEQQFGNSFENTYVHIPLSEWDKERLAFLPLVVEGAKGKKVLITETDLLDYPGMYLNNPDGGKMLKGVYATYPKTIEQGGHNQLQGLVKTREAYIAKFEKGTKNFPWRIVEVSTKDAELADNTMTYKLATPSQLSDIAWIKPGKVAWDWWNDWNIQGVNFRSGINNDTYKYYIDFASKNGIEYVILDEGWAVNRKADLMQVVPEINLQELADYAKSKNVGLILWAGYWAFNRDLEGVCKHYSEMGIKGFKVDFMDRDDQPMVEFFVKAAQTAAKYKLMLDYHGAFKPSGINRTYPNVINFEGVHGLEQMKWSPNTVDQVTYDVTIPFIRMAAGPMDYTQGAMRNATKRNYFPVNTEPMSQGTRCHQLAEYVIFESPLNMLCDAPSNYLREPECLDFIAKIPTVWDDTKALNGEIAKYVSIARKKGDTWYVGSLTNWDKRDLELDLSFLGEGSYRADVYKDGVNADRVACDYVKETIDIPSDRKLKISMAPGGGFAMRISKK